LGVWTGREHEESSGPRGYNIRMGPRGVFVGEKVRLPDWYDPPEGMLDAPVVAEVLTEHRAFSTHTLAKVSWSVANPEGGGTTRQTRLFRVEDLKPA
jgi:hypothetical protein